MGRGGHGQEPCLAPLRRCEAGPGQGKPCFHWKWHEWVALDGRSLSGRLSPKTGQVDVVYGKGSAGGGRYTRLHPSLPPFVATLGKPLWLSPGLGHALPRDAPQGVRYLNTTMSPVPSSSSQCLSPYCSSDHLAPVPPGSTDAGYAQSQVLGWVQPNAHLHVLADPFYPQRAPQSLPPEEGVQGWHGLGKGRRKCPVKCSILSVGWGCPKGSAGPGACPGSGGHL